MDLTYANGVLQHGKTLNPLLQAVVADCLLSPFEGLKFPQITIDRSKPLLDSLSSALANQAVQSIAVLRQRHFAPPHFAFSDDTVLSMATLAVLMQSPNPDAIPMEAVAQSFQQWGAHFQVACRGFGSNFTHWLQEDPRAESALSNSSSNGCLMRLSPLLTLQYPPHQLQAIAQTMTRVTHNHPDSLEAVSLWVQAHQPYSAQTPPTLLQYQQTLLELLRTFPAPKSLDYWYTQQGFVLNSKQTIQMALCIASQSDSWFDCFEHILRIGGDTDTLGVVCSTLLFPFLGPIPIPKERVDQWYQSLFDALGE